MEVTSIDAKTGKEVKVSIPDPEPKFFDFANSFELNDAELRSRIDHFNVSADTKALLYSFAKATIKVGKVIVKIGRKLIDLLFSLVRQFTSLTFGAVFGLLVGLLISAIPVIGVVLGPIAIPLCTAFGVAVGGYAELQAGNLKGRLDAILAEFAPLRA